MSIASVLVTGILRMPSGLPASLASVRFVLTSPGLRGVTVVLPASTKVTADANGLFSVSLLPNAKHTFYAVTVFRSTGTVLLETVAVVPSVDCNFSQIIQIRQSNSVSASIAAIADLQTAQAEIETARLSVITTAIASNAGSEAAMDRLEIAVDDYEELIENNEATIAELVEVALEASLDLAAAYQLST